jgi:membrane-bound metal-dependent hydrolase YbcI (DUF457 family)
MKGITHFLTGLALATLYPEVIHAAESGSILPVLGGLGGILPDFLDFKFVQFWEAYDAEVDPGSEPNAEHIADAIVNAMTEAYDSAMPFHIKLHTIRLSADTWQRYSLDFLPSTGELLVGVGPEVATDQKSNKETHGMPLQTARRFLPFALHVNYQQHYEVDAFQGPSFLFSREKNTIRIRFLDWHRRWTHSLLVAPVVGLFVFLVAGLIFNWSTAFWSGLVSWVGYSAHVLEDQLGYLGSRLWWPLDNHPQPGLKWFHASEVMPNFICVWLSLALILYNIDRYGSSLIPVRLLLILGIGIPLILILFTIGRNRKQRQVDSLANTPKESTE